MSLITTSVPLICGCEISSAFQLKSNPLLSLITKIHEHAKSFYEHTKHKIKNSSAQEISLSVLLSIVHKHTNQNTRINEIPENKRTTSNVIKCSNTIATGGVIFFHITASKSMNDGSHSTSQSAIRVI